MGLAVGLALGLGLGPGSARAAEPAPPPAAGGSPDRAGPAYVVVDATEIGTLSSAALTEISHSATLRAAEHGLEPHQLTISLVVLDHLEAIRGVRVAIVTPTHTLTSDDGDPRGPLVAECTACAEAELMTLSTEGLLTALQRYDELIAPPRTAGGQPEGEPPPADVPVTAAAPPPRAALGRLGWAGVVTVGTGGAAVVTGMVLAGLGRRPPAIETAQDLLRDYATPGYVLLGVGGALVVTGAVLLGVDRRRARGRVAPLGAVRSVRLELQPRGLAVRGRF